MVLQRAAWTDGQRAPVAPAVIAHDLKVGEEASGAGERRAAVQRSMHEHYPLGPHGPAVFGDEEVSHSGAR